MAAVSFFGLAAAFLAALLLYPHIQSYLARREHRSRMYNRRPFSRGETPRRGRSSRKDG